MYFVYIVKCSDNTLYTWITTNIDRRIKEHNWKLSGWAKYTKNRQPVKLLYYEKYKNRSDASKREYEIKKLKREKKLKLIELNNYRKN
jgi:putative endonuclease